MSIEKPLITWKMIAAYLRISRRLAKKLLKHHVKYIGKRVAIYPSMVKRLIEQERLSMDLREVRNRTPTDPQQPPNGPLKTPETDLQNTK